MLGILFDDNVCKIQKIHALYGDMCLFPQICVSFHCPKKRAQINLRHKHTLAFSSTTHAAKQKLKTAQFLPHFRYRGNVNSTYLSATALEDLDKGRDGPSILEQGLEGHLGLADGVGIRMGEGGEELGQLSGRVG